jgi:hypothetical protein
MSTNRRPLKHKAAKVTSIVSREEAKALKVSYYFTGKPCNRGHLSPRNVSNRACVDCLLIWRNANPHAHRKSSANWKKNNAGHNSAIMAKRRADKLQRTPAWMTKEQLAAIDKLYKQAVWLTKITGVKWHVDHIVPLKGKNVSGLHIPDNLQVIPALENIKKGNRLATLKRAARRKK